jgi:hypothetical protein
LGVILGVSWRPANSSASSFTAKVFGEGVPWLKYSRQIPTTTTKYCTSIIITMASESGMNVSLKSYGSSNDTARTPASNPEQEPLFKNTIRVENGEQNLSMELSFRRTIRVPDDGNVYNMPPDLGRFPLYSVAQYKTLPQEIVQKGGCFLPIYGTFLWSSICHHHKADLFRQSRRQFGFASKPEALSQSRYTLERLMQYLESARPRSWGTSSG